jgi:uncharacterized membrane-anchored protein
MALGWFKSCATALMLTVAGTACAHADAAADRRDALAAARAKAVKGPIEISIGEQGKLVVPAGFAFASSSVSSKLAGVFARPASEGAFIGVVTSTKAGDGFVAAIGYSASGHVDDTQANQWRPDAILTALHAQAQHDAPELAARGAPPRQIAGWAAAPTYDAARKILSWSLAYRSAAAPAGQQDSVQASAFVLGRSGHFTVDAEDAPGRTVEAAARARNLAANIAFSDSYRFERYDPASDATARTGLGAWLASPVESKTNAIVTLGSWLLWLIALAVVAALIAGFVFVTKALRPAPEGSAVRR